jgi:hypothetical protein
MENRPLDLPADAASRHQRRRCNGAGGPGDGDYMFWDVQNAHLTFDIQSGGQINAREFDNYERWGTPGGMDQVMP